MQFIFFCCLLIRLLFHLSSVAFDSLVMPVVIVYVSTPKAPRYLCSCKFTIDRGVDFSMIAAHGGDEEKEGTKICADLAGSLALIAHCSDQFISSRNVISQECFCFEAKVESYWKKYSPYHQ